MQKSLIAIILLFTSWTAAAQSAWTELGTGLNVFVGINGLALDTADHVVAAGNILNAAMEYHVTRWNGSAWAELGSGPTALHANGGFSAVATDTLGNVYATGAMTNSSGMRYVAKWDGTVWTELGAGGNELNANGLITALATDNAGNVYAGGQFSDASGKRYVAKWDGNTWTALDNFSNGSIYALCTDIYGNVYASGSMYTGSINYYVAKWDGTAWSKLGSSTFNNHVIIPALCSDKEGNIYAGGLVGSSPYFYIGKFDGTSWSEVGPGAAGMDWEGGISSICVDTSGNLYAAGANPNASGKYYIAKWDQNTWSELGTGIDALNANAPARKVIADHKGNIYTTGDFTGGSLGKPYVAKYTPPVLIDSVVVQSALPPLINTYGGSLQLTGVVYPPQASQLLYWSVTPSSVASVSGTGLVTAISDGTAWIKVTAVRDSAKTDSIAVTVSGQSVSINEVQHNGILRMYPNPVTKILHLLVDAVNSEPATLQIATIAGQVIRQERLSGKKTEIDAQDLPAGLYFLDYRSGTEHIRLKFVKR